MKTKIILMMLLLGFIGNEANAIWIVRLECHDKCAKIIHQEWPGLTIDKCKGVGKRNCHMSEHPGGGGIGISLAAQINSATDIEKALMRQVEQEINRGKKTGFILHNAADYSLGEINRIRGHAQRLLQMADAEPEEIAPFSNVFNFAVWRIDSNGSITIVVDSK
jgi:hypothetical protein